MEIRELLVSILLLHKIVHGTISLAAATITPVLKSGLSSNENKSLLNFNQNNYSTGNNQKNFNLSSARLTYTAKERPKIQAIAPLQNWNKIFFFNNKKESDSLQNASEPIKNIYTNTRNLLLLKIQTWLNNGDNLDTVAEYLGYDEQTIDLINISMTELLSEKRACHVQIDDLVSLFYYSCDLKAIAEDSLTDVNGVKQKLQTLTDKFSMSANEIEQLKKDDLIENLKSNLKLIENKGETPFGMTIHSMKMKIFMEPTQNEIMNKLKDRYYGAFNTKKIPEFVKTYTSEIDGDRVRNYHSGILNVLITDIFGYAFNHFDLLTQLREYELDDTDKEIIKKFTTFMNDFTFLFINRSFELNGIISLEVRDAMRSLILFLNPKNVPSAYNSNLTEEDKENFKNSNYGKSVKFETSILDYYNDQKRNTELNGYMIKLIQNATIVILDSFTMEDQYEWDQIRVSKLNFNLKQATNKKQCLLDQIDSNTKNAMSILNEFSKEFILGKELYDKYDLNEVTPQ